MKNERKEKIKDLKNRILVEQNALVEATKTALPPEELLKLEESQQREKSEEFKADVMKRKANISVLKDELKHVRMNKYSSQFFTFIPSRPNRRMMRLARKLKHI